jgi:hypothetical protein
MNHGRLELRRNFFSVRVIHGRNRIPADIKSEPKIALFRSKYKKLRAFRCNPQLREWTDKKGEMKMRPSGLDVP